MSSIFSKACDYSQQAVMYLSAQEPGKWVQQSIIAEDLGIPNDFLGKILQQLTRHRLVKSQRGKRGGFTLNKVPEDITLYSIVEIVDGKYFLEHCIMGFTGCTDETPCPLHEEWSDIKQTIIEMLKRETVASMAVGFTERLQSLKSAGTGG